MTTTSDQKMAQLIQEELKERLRTLQELVRQEESMDDECELEGAQSWLLERINIVLATIDELMQKHEYVSGDVLDVATVMMKSDYYGWEEEHVKDSYSEQSNSIPVQLIRRLESEYGLSTKEASNIIQDIADEGTVEWIR